MLAERMTTKQADYAWVPLKLAMRGKNDVPDGAVLAGSENGKPKFVGRVQHNGHWEIAKLNDWGCFGYGYYGREYESTKGEVLVALHGQEPVWISSGFGEHINEAIFIQSDNHQQLVGRVWFKDRWIPGKINTESGRIYFPFGGKEYSSRHYQVLLDNLTWQKVAKSPPRWLVPVDNMSPVSLENSVHHAQSSWQGDRLRDQRLDGKQYRLVQKTLDFFSARQRQLLLQECKWVVSGDGEGVRHAVMIHDHQIGRVRSPSGAEWLHGYVVPSGGHRPGLHVGNHQYSTYQVLTANCNRQRAFSVQLSGETEGTDSKLTSPNEVFLVAKVGKGESADAALQDMLSEYQACRIVDSLPKPEHR